MPAMNRSYQALLTDITRLYTQTRASVVRMYWEIGRRIVEGEQEGADSTRFRRRRQNWKSRRRPDSCQAPRPRSRWPSACRGNLDGCRSRTGIMFDEQLVLDV